MEKRDQSRTGHNYPNLFRNIFGGHFVSREMFGFNMFWMSSRSWTAWRIMLVPLFQCSTRNDEECFGPNEYAKFLENNIGSETGFESPNYKTLLREMKTIRFRNIERFTVDEPHNALKHRRRNKCADSNGIVAACFVYRTLRLHERLLPLLN